MFGKMVLPLLGGTPGVWNTCIVFFQATLLAGYAYSHSATAWLGIRRQAALHIVLLISPLLTLPIALPRNWVPPVEQNPVWWLLALLVVSVGLPFLVVSTSAPLLQKWFAHTGHPAAKDPYFLYGVSNLGSMLALLGYPLLMEPNFPLPEQSLWWAGGYGLLVVLTVSVSWILRRAPVVSPVSHSPVSAGAQQSSSSRDDSTHVPTLGRRSRWVLLSFVPSSLMLGLTTYLTTDIAAVPLLWVIPLTIYLLSFILVFARRPLPLHELMVRVLPILISPLVILMLSNTVGPMWLLVPLHLLTFFVAAMICHGELVRDRPPTQYLTDFYLWMAVGGVLGGMFNALVAPIIFDSVVEYPMAMVLACLLRPATDSHARSPLGHWLDVGLPLLLGVLVVGLALGLKWSGLREAWLIITLLFALPVIICFSFRDRPIRFGLGIAAIMLASTVSAGMQGRELHAVRSFFGVHRVIDDTGESYRMLFHGTTLHGMQSLDPVRRQEPLTYFYRTGPIGQLFTVLSESLTRPHVAIIGLGAGSLACYGKVSQHWTFYEIDPAVERIARQYFTYLRDCPPKINAVLGDGRLSLAKAPDRHYGLIVFDAFSSDAIPVHLVSREATELYLTKLADGGILAFNISNRYLDLKPVLGRLAGHLGLFGLVQEDREVNEEERKNGKAPSDWVVMARQREELAKLAQDQRWKPLPTQPGVAVWTDDFSNILGLIKWHR